MPDVGGPHGLATREAVGAPVRRAARWRPVANLVLGVAVGVAGLAIAPTLPGVTVSAVSPTPSPAVAGDTRSAGEGPGLVGSPLLAIGVVLGIGLLAALVTVTYVRLSPGHTRVAPRRPGVGPGNPSRPGGGDPPSGS